MVRRINAKRVLKLRAEGLPGRSRRGECPGTRRGAMLDAADREGVGLDDVGELDEADV
jgi:hypothetical protein